MQAELSGRFWLHLLIIITVKSQNIETVSGDLVAEIQMVCF